MKYKEEKIESDLARALARIRADETTVYRPPHMQSQLQMHTEGVPEGVVEVMRSIPKIQSWGDEEVKYEIGREKMMAIEKTRKEYSAQLAEKNAKIDALTEKLASG